MSSSSSDEENDKQIREAVDPVFFSDDLYQSNEKTAKEIKEKSPNIPHSLRIKNQPINTFNPLEIRVTPEFRAHVSKHLRRLLDELIDDEHELPIIKKKEHQTKNIYNGIKLLKTSESCIKETYRETDISAKKRYIKRKRKKIDNESSDDDEAKAKEVAVSADWILSGKATEGWAPNTRGEVEIITMKPYT